MLVVNMGNDYIIKHAQRLYNTIIAEVSFENNLPVKVAFALFFKNPKQVYMLIKYNETTKTYHLTKMFDAKGHVKEEIKYVKKEDMDYLLNWIRDNPKDLVSLPSFAINWL